MDESESRIEYLTSRRDPEQVNRMQLEVSGEQIGFARLKLHHEPFEFYEIPMIMVDPDKQGQGHGRELLVEINKLLDSKSMPGFLMNAVDPNSKARGMYERNGWSPIQGHEDWLGYNIQSIRPEIIEEAVNSLDGKKGKKIKPVAA